MLVSLRLLLVQVINQCCEESAGSRLAAAALLVTCRGWGSELRLRCGLPRLLSVGRIFAVSQRVSY